MRTYIDVYYHDARDGWVLAWAHPTVHGHEYDPPMLGIHPTKATAIRRRREIYNEIGMYPRPSGPATAESKARYQRRKARVERIRRVAERARTFIDECGMGLREAVSKAKAEVG